MQHDMTDRIEYDTRTITILERDIDAARRRWLKKGWVVAHQNASEPVPGTSERSVTLHMQRPAT